MNGLRVAAVAAIYGEVTTGTMEDYKALTEDSTVRENLMEREHYSPYCGDGKCIFRMPRTAFSPKLNQFTCKCGWVSGFPESFIKTYLTRWAAPQK